MGEDVAAMAVAVPNTGDTVTQRLAGMAGQPLDGPVTGSWAGGSEAASPDVTVATAQLRHRAWLKSCVWLAAKQRASPANCKELQGGSDPFHAGSVTLGTIPPPIPDDLQSRRRHFLSGISLRGVST